MPLSPLGSGSFTSQSLQSCQLLLDQQLSTRRTGRTRCTCPCGQCSPFPGCHIHAGKRQLEEMTSSSCELAGQIS